MAGVGIRASKPPLRLERAARTGPHRLSSSRAQAHADLLDDFCNKIGYNQLQRAIIAVNGRSSRLATALGHDLKGKLSLASYIVSVPLAFFNPWIAVTLYIIVALMWFMPDRRIETATG